jgi:hypothetical protein
VIPKIIHFVWIGSPLPAWAEKNIAEFRRLNPDYEIKIHGEDVLLDQYKETYAKVQRLDSRSDLLRVSALRRFGGWYFDTDFWPLRPLDAAVEAWGIDGSRLFLARQHYQKNLNLYIANGILAGSTDCPAWPCLDKIFAEQKPEERTAFGPQSMVKLASAHPEKVQLSGWPWWFPAGQLNAVKFIGQRAEIMRELEPETGGQLPFAMHLWAAGKPDLPKQVCNKVYGSGDRLAMLVLNESLLRNREHRMNGLVRGLNACGFRVEVAEPSGKEELLDRCSAVPDVVVFWNGKRRPELLTQAKRMRIPTLITEHVFFQRDRYVQADHEGFLHWASWRELLRMPAPECGRQRFENFYPDGVAPMRINKQGYVLVLGQVASDTQLFDSEIQGPMPLQREIRNAMPEGVTTYFRPHPQCSHVDLRRNILPLMNAEQEQMQYARTRHGCGLAEALKNARFCIAINSNALNEALAAGIPCLAFGPFLGIHAGAVKKTTVATLATDLREMLKGWMPEQADVENYLHWLAARQWNPEELAQPEYLLPLLQAAGVEIQEVAHV